MQNKNDDSPADSSNDLGSIASDEREFVRETLREELGHDPSEEELNEWLREHTESY